MTLLTLATVPIGRVSIVAQAGTLAFLVCLQVAIDVWARARRSSRVHLLRSDVELCPICSHFDPLAPVESCTERCFRWVTGRQQLAILQRPNAVPSGYGSLDDGSKSAASSPAAAAARAPALVPATGGSKNLAAPGGEFAEDPVESVPCADRRFLCCGAVCCSCTWFRLCGGYSKVDVRTAQALEAAESAHHGSMSHAHGEDKYIRFRAAIRRFVAQAVADKLDTLRTDKSPSSKPNGLGS